MDLNQSIKEFQIPQFAEKIQNTQRAQTRKKNNDQEIEIIDKNQFF